MVVGAVVLAGPAPTQAATPVSGSIRDAYWTKAGSPYLVRDDLLVASLTVDPGVQVLFEGPYTLEVAGVLRALGTPSEPIQFTRTGQGTWRGIFFNHSPAGSELRWCTVSRADHSGIRIEDSTPLLRHCTIRENSAPGSGGGLSAKLQGLPGATLELADCVIADNVANAGKAAGNFGGGGLAIWGRAEITRCTIRSNVCYSRCEEALKTVVAAGGGLYGEGEAHVVACRVEANRTETWAACDWPWIEVRHLAPVGGGVGWGNGTLRLVNSIVAGNTLTAVPINSRVLITPRGSGLFLFGGTSTILNSTLVHNGQGGTVWAGAGSIALTNAIVFHVADTAVGVEAGATLLAAYSDIEGGYPGHGNLNVTDRNLLLHGCT